MILSARNNQFKFDFHYYGSFEAYQWLLVSKSWEYSKFLFVGLKSYSNHIANVTVVSPCHFTFKKSIIDFLTDLKSYLVMSIYFKAYLALSSVYSDWD